MSDPREKTGGASRDPASPRRRAEALFQEAADLPAEERAAFLDGVPDLDLKLRRRVERLLERMDDGRVASLAAVDALDDASDGGVGKRIGPFRLTELLGEGGFGSVYRARQEAPLRREVALKLLKPGMDSRQVIARFEAERQALALMNHPHIARVFDAGSTDRGRPYFAMELVEGRPITTFCDERRLDIPGRLSLFLDVCGAVQHAHQKSIIHRDLKPSNILVESRDGEPTPKVIDFGIARALDPSLADPALLTRYGLFLGTPEYMSPEQVEGAGGDRDTRTDIYALGILLYELLTGCTPSGATRGSPPSFAEMQRRILEERPPKPSKRVTSLRAGAADRARARRTAPASLVRSLKGELDWIVMKALEKEPARRYETVESLAADVRRHLGGEPVLAGPPSRVYRLRKAVARNRAVFGLAAALFILAVSAAIWLSVLLAGSNRLRRDAEEGKRTAEALLARARTAEAKALTEADTSRQVMEFLVSLFELADPSHNRGESVTVRELLDRGAARVLDRLADRPEILAPLCHSLGQVYANLGLYRRARPLLERALDLLSDLYGPDHRRTLYARIYLGRLHMLDRDFDRAEALLREGLAGARRALGNDDRVTLKAVKYLAWVLQQQGDHAGAEPLCREALATNRRLLGPEDPDSLGALQTLAWLLLHQGRHDEALALGEEALATGRRVHGPDHADTAVALNFLGGLLAECGRDLEAADRFRDAAAIRARALGMDHPLALEAESNRAEALLRGGDATGAEAIFERLHRRFETALGPVDRRTETALVGRARARFALGDERGGHALLDRVEAALNRALEDRAREQGADHPDSIRLEERLEKFRAIRFAYAAPAGGAEDSSK